MAAWVSVNVSGMPCAPRVFAPLDLSLFVARNHVICRHAPLRCVLAILTFVAPFFVVKSFAWQKFVVAMASIKFGVPVATSFFACGILVPLVATKLGACDQANEGLNIPTTSWLLGAIFVTVKVVALEDDIISVAPCGLIVPIASRFHDASFFSEIFVAADVVAAFVAEVCLRCPRATFLIGAGVFVPMVVARHWVEIEHLHALLLRLVPTTPFCTSAFSAVKDIARRLHIFVDTSGPMRVPVASILDPGLLAAFVSVEPIARQFFAVLVAGRGVRVVAATLLLVAIILLVVSIAPNLLPFVPTKMEVLMPVASVGFCTATFGFVVPFAIWNCVFVGTTVNLGMPIALSLPNSFVQASIFIVDLCARDSITQTRTIVEPVVPFTLGPARFKLEKCGARLVCITASRATFVQWCGKHLILWT